MKRWLLIGVAVLLAPIVVLGGCIAFVGGIVGIDSAAVQQCSDTAATSTQFVDPVSGVSLDTTGLKVKTASMKRDQAKNATTIAGIVAARSDDFPGDLQHKATVIAYATVIVESEMRNLAFGTGKSAGIFQQIPGWGTYVQRTNVTYATNAFLNALLKVSGWQDMQPGDAAQAVQRSSYPDRYAAYVNQAELIYSHLSFNGDSTAESVSSTLGTDCGQQSEIEKKINIAVQSCLSKLGSDYSWKKPADGASFVSWCYQQAGLALPKSIDKLANFDGDTSTGLSASWIPASSIVSRQETLLPGDIPFYTDNHFAPSRNNVTSVGLYLGTGEAGDLKVASYNVRGSTHTPSSGSQSGPERIKRAAALILSNHFSVVGLQELQMNQRAQLLRSLGSGYGIYPDKAQYGLHQPGINSVNSIIWDKSQVSFVDGKSLPMPYYFNRRAMHIPLVKLQEITSGQQFYVTNTHDPAMNPFARLRFLDAHQHASDMDSLTQQGLPVFFSGDFNSPYSLNGKANPVWQHKRQNLTWCIMTRSGSMLDGYDAAKRPVRTGECPQQTTAELGVGTIDHVFVSKNISVTGWHRIENRNLTASDHGVTYIDARLPGVPVTRSKHASKYGEYVGVNGKQKISLLPVSQQKLAGVLRLNITTASGGTGPGSDFIGNDGFPGGSCVKYVEWILDHHSSKYHRQVDITTGNQGVAAYTVADNLGKTLGYTVDHTPAIHATVSFGTQFADSTFGHVAIVAQINKDGSIVVEEANWANYHAYGTHPVPASEVPQLTYAHTEVGWH